MIRVQLLCLLICLLFPATRAYSADEFEAIGVAKVGDGSETAKAWDALQKAAADSHRQVTEAIEKAKQDGTETSSSSGNQDIRPKMDGTTPAHWVVRFKAAPITKQAARMPDINWSFSGEVYASAANSSYIFNFKERRDQPTWIAVLDQNASEQPQNEQSLQSIIQVIKLALAKAGHPITDAQQQKIQTILAQPMNTQLIPLWKALSEKPSDNALAIKFLSAFKLAALQTSEVVEKLQDQLMSVFTKEQLRVLGLNQGNSNTGAVTSSASGPGSYGVSGVTINGKQTLTVTISGKHLDDAFEALVGTVNNAFHAKLSVPKLPANLAEKAVTAKLTIDSAEGALEKLANAAGVKLEKQGADLVVVAGKN